MGSDESTGDVHVDDPTGDGPSEPLCRLTNERREAVAALAAHSRRREMATGTGLIQRHAARLLVSRNSRAWSRAWSRARRAGTTTTSATMSRDPGPRRARVAVVGGGAAGLAAARELRAEGHTPVVFERGNDAGGVWVYDPRVEVDDVTGTDPNRARVHGSMYASLRTNLPRECMGYESFPFTKTFAGDDRRFCGHGEVRAYLAAYADHHDIAKDVRLRREVLSAEPIVDDWRAEDDAKAASNHQSEKDSGDETWGPRWRVTTRSTGDDDDDDDDANVSVETFDAVVVCNGHYSEPRTPSYANAKRWPGLQMHSHNYRTPDATFKGKKVVVLGAMASGEDLTREIATVASDVVLAARGFVPGAPKNDFPVASYPKNATLKPGIVELIPERSGVRFEDGSVEEDVDVILYATGYQYAFPFLSDAVSDGYLSAVDNCVSPLYKHVFPPALAPSLSFIGLPWKVVPFPQFETQARWIAKALSGAAPLPPRREMLDDADAFERSLASNGIARRHAHRMGDAQFAYNDELRELCGQPPAGTWRAEMYAATGARKRSQPASYRDGPIPWSDEAARADARAEADAAGFGTDPARDEVEAGAA